MFLPRSRSQSPKQNDQKIEKMMNNVKRPVSTSKGACEIILGAIKNGKVTIDQIAKTCYLDGVSWAEFPKGKSLVPVKDMRDWAHRHLQAPNNKKDRRVHTDGTYHWIESGSTGRDTIPLITGVV